MWAGFQRPHTAERTGLRGRKHEKKMRRRAAGNVTGAIFKKKKNQRTTLIIFIEPSILDPLLQ